MNPKAQAACYLPYLSMRTSDMTTLPFMPKSILSGLPDAQAGTIEVAGPIMVYPFALACRGV